MTTLQDFMGEECPVCLVLFREGAPGDSPSNRNEGYYDVQCGHYVCMECLREMKSTGNIHCPICRGCWCQFIDDITDDDITDDDLTTDEDTTDNEDEEN